MIKPGFYCREVIFMILVLWFQTELTRLGMSMKDLRLQPYNLSKSRLLASNSLLLYKFSSLVVSYQPEFSVALTRVCSKFNVDNEKKIEREKRFWNKQVAKCGESLTCQLSSILGLELPAEFTRRSYGVQVTFGGEGRQTSSIRLVGNRQSSKCRTLLVSAQLWDCGENHYACCHELSDDSSLAGLFTSMLVSQYTLPTLTRSMIHY